MLEINPNMKFGVITDDPENAKKFIPWAPIIGASAMDEQDPLAHLQGSGFYEYKGGPIGIDYSIHVWRKFEANRESGMGTWAYMIDMYATTGSALIMSAGTTICGFMVGLQSPVPVIKEYGLESSISDANSISSAIAFVS